MFHGPATASLTDDLASQLGLPVDICKNLLATGWSCNVQTRTWRYITLEVPKTHDSVLHRLIELGWAVMFNQSLNTYDIMPVYTVQYTPPERTTTMQNLLKYTFDELIHPKLSRKRRAPKHVKTSRRKTVFTH